MSVRRETTKSKPKHRRPSVAARQGQRAVVFGVTGTMAAGGFVLAANSAVAAERITSQATGRFLSGSVGGTDLDTIVALAGAAAKNTGQATTQSETNPLDATLLNALHLPLGGGINLLENNGILTLGAVQQYAAAKADGSSVGASGAVTDSGAIAINGQGGVPANATLDLTDLLGGGVLGTVASLNAQIGALSAVAEQAAGANGNQTGDYQIAELTLNLNSPALAGILSTLDGVLGGLDTNLPGLLNTAGGLGLGGLVSISGLTDLTTILDGMPVSFGSLNNDGINVNLSNGNIQIDLENILDSLGLDLNNLPPNTNLVPYILGALDGIVPQITSALDGVLTQVTTALTPGTSGLGGTVELIPGTPVPIVGPLLTTLLGSVPVVDTLSTALGTATSALGTATTGQNNLLGGVGGGLLDIPEVLDDVLDLVANVQVNRNNGGTFTQRALSLGLLDAVDVNLASATVGPNLGPVAATLAPPFISDPKNGDETTDTTPPISGTGVAGAKVTVKEGSKTLCTATVASTGKWKCTSVKLALGSHTISATQTLNGLTSAKSNVVTFKVVKTTTTDDGSLPATGGNGSTAPLAAAGLGLLLGGMGLSAAPRLARHGGGGSGGGGAHARGGRHAKR